MARGIHPRLHARGVYSARLPRSMNGSAEATAIFIFTQAMNHMLTSVVPPPHVCLQLTTFSLLEAAFRNHLPINRRSSLHYFASVRDCGLAVVVIKEVPRTLMQMCGRRNSQSSHSGELTSTYQQQCRRRHMSIE